MQTKHFPLMPALGVTLVLMVAGCSSSGSSTEAVAQTADSGVESPISAEEQEATTTVGSPEPTSTVAVVDEPPSSGLSEESSYVIEALLGTTISDLTEVESIPCDDGLERKTGPWEPEIAGAMVPSRPIVDGDLQRTSYSTRCEVVNGTGAQPATLFFYEEPVLASEPDPSTSSEAAEDGGATEAAIGVAFDGAVLSYNTCLEQLPKCDIAGPSAWRTGTQLAQLQSQIATWNASDFFVTDVDTRTQAVLSINVTSETTAELASCEYDASTLLQAADAAIGRAEEVIDGDEISTTQTWQLELVAGEWKVADIVDRIATLNRGNKCA